MYEFDVPRMNLGYHTELLFGIKCRSCDLDEWTQTQLDTMKVGGNANCLSFMKKHGVTDTQMLVRFEIFNIYVMCLFLLLYEFYYVYGSLFSVSCVFSLRRSMTPKQLKSTRNYYRDLYLMKQIRLEVVVLLVRFRMCKRRRKICPSGIRIMD